MNNTLWHDFILASYYSFHLGLGLRLYWNKCSSVCYETCSLMKTETIKLLCSMSKRLKYKPDNKYIGKYNLTLTQWLQQQQLRQLQPSFLRKLLRQLLLRGNCLLLKLINYSFEDKNTKNIFTIRELSSLSTLRKEVV